MVGPRGGASPYKHFLNTPSPSWGGGGGGRGTRPKTQGYLSHCDMATFQTGPLEPRPRWRENTTLPRPLVH